MALTREAYDSIKEGSDAAKAIRAELQATLDKVQQTLDEIERKIAAYDIVMQDFVDKPDVVAVDSEGKVWVVEAKVVNPLASNGYRGTPAIDQVLLYGWNQPNHGFNVKELIYWLVEHEIFADSHAAHRGLDSQLNRRTDLFEHIARGEYDLTEKAIQRAEQIAAHSSQ